MQCETQIHGGQRELTDAELSQVVGGDSMDLIAQAWANVTKDCLFRLTRVGTVIDCSGGPKRLM